MTEPYAALQQDETRASAAEIIRTIVTEIVLTPEDGELKINVRGDLAGILTIALNRKGASQGKSSAGTQIGRPDVRAADLIEQVKMVAGARRSGNRAERFVE